MRAARRGRLPARGGDDPAALLLDDEEAVATAVALRTIATGAIAGIDETSVRALSKLARLLPQRLRERVDALAAATATAPPSGGPEVDLETLATLALASRDAERVSFRHAGRHGPAQRLAEPHRLVSLGRRWYLVAWDLDRQDWRTFRIDRVERPEVTGGRFHPRRLPGADPVAYVEASIAAAPVRHEVDVRVHAPRPTSPGTSSAGAPSRPRATAPAGCGCGSTT
jgi:predicted DNA-binding transcriptional regulator YafY